jgi:hypothetical protein
VLLEHLASDQGHVDNLAPPHTWHRVEVDAQFVGMSEIVGAHGMGIEVDAAHVDRPHQASGVVDHGFLGRCARGVLQFGDVDEIRPLLGCALLEDSFFGDALDEPLEDHRPVLHTAQGTAGDSEVVVDQVEFRDADIGENDLVRVGDGHLPTAHVQRHGSGHIVMVISPSRCETGVT